jgi:hypothetical protein
MPQFQQINGGAVPVLGDTHASPLTTWAGGALGPICQRTVRWACGWREQDARGRGQGRGWAQTCITRYSQA